MAVESTDDKAEQVARIEQRLARLDREPPGGFLLLGRPVTADEMVVLYVLGGAYLLLLLVAGILRLGPFLGALAAAIGALWGYRAGENAAALGVLGHAHRRAQARRELRALLDDDYTACVICGDDLDDHPGDCDGSPLVAAVRLYGRSIGLLRRRRA